MLGERNNESYIMVYDRELKYVRCSRHDNRCVSAYKHHGSLCHRHS